VTLFPLQQHKISGTQDSMSCMLRQQEMIDMRELFQVRKRLMKLEESGFLQHSDSLQEREKIKSEEKMRIDSFEELKTYLRQFTTWGDRGGFDFCGATHLLMAIMDCIRLTANDAELEEMRELLDEEQVAFIVRLAQSLTSAKKL
jgi:hypothetical protein